MAAQDEREERDRYAEKHERYRLAQDEALAIITREAFLRTRPSAADLGLDLCLRLDAARVRRGEFLRNRPDAERYVLAEYKRGVK